MLWRQSWRPHQRKQHIGSRYARDRMLRRGLRLRHDQKAHSGTHETHQRPSVGLRWGRRTRDNHSSPHRGWESDRSILSRKSPKETRGWRKGSGRKGSRPGQAKGQTQRWQPLQPNLERVNEAARRSGQTRFTALLHHVDVAALERAFRRQRRAASPGIDRVKGEAYEGNLEVNLQRLHARIHSGQYWPKPVRRTYIPKADGSLRPLGIPTLEDKIVQGAVAEVLNAVYEADFLGFSHGFRPERSPHSALAALDKALMTQRVNFVLDVDIRTFLDTVDHGWLMRMLAHR